MRRLFTIGDAMRQGLTRSALRWGERTGRWRRVDFGVYGEGDAEPDALDRARARVLASGGVASGRLAAMLHELDGVTELDGRAVRRRELPPDDVVVVGGIPCTNGLRTLVDVARDLNDDEWEQALEASLRKKLTSIDALEATLPALRRTRTRGVRRIRRVLALRPDGARPTESPLELDGQQHKDQPVYDARRETAVVAATGWLPGRFTWHEVVGLPTTTARRLADLAEQGRRLAGLNRSSR